MSAANHAFHDGFDKNGRKINNNGGDEIDYRYDDDGNIISSTAVEIRYSKTSERDLRIYGLKIEATGGGLYDPTWDLFGGAVSFGKLFSGLKLLNTKLLEVTGGLKQWVRFGKSYSKSGKFKTYSLKWGAGKNHYKKIGNPNLQNMNRSLRNYKIPYNSWRTSDPGHFHFKKLR